MCIMDLSIYLQIGIFPPSISLSLYPTLTLLGPSPRPPAHMPALEMGRNAHSGGHNGEIFRSHVQTGSLFGRVPEKSLYMYCWISI